jgi:hypothetical protein
VKGAVSLALVIILTYANALAQAPSGTIGAAESIQLSKPGATASTRRPKREIIIPAGTPIDIEATYTVNSRDLRAGDFISFRVLVPIQLEGLTLVDKGSLVTGRVVEAKRGGHWGKAGRLSWIIQDVVAADLTRVPLQAQLEGPEARSAVKGTSHGGQVATEMIVFGSLMFIAAPLVLMSGFKRGEDAILPQGKRLIVYVAKDTTLRMQAEGN